MSRRRESSTSATRAWRVGATAGLAAVALGMVGLGGGSRPPASEPMSPSASPSVPHPTEAAAGRVSPATGKDRALLLDERLTTAIQGLPPSAGARAAKLCGARAEGAVEAQEAETLVGKTAAVEFRVARTFDSGKVTFLNSQDPYEGHFYVAIFPDDYGAFPAPPAEYFDGKCVVVQGRVELYRGTPQMVLKVTDDILVMGE